MFKLEMPDFRRQSDIDNATPEEIEKSYLQTMAKQAGQRSILAPAEAINPLTVGAWHADECDHSNIPDSFIDVLPNKDGPSFYTPIGLGHKGTIKPDVLYDGGRLLVRAMPDNGKYAFRASAVQSKYVGQKVATPSNIGETNRTTNTAGTSNAAALITHHAIRLDEMLTELGQEHSELAVPDTHRAVMLKTLLMHGCSWKDRGHKLEKFIEPQPVVVNNRTNSRWQARRTNIARLLGMGRPDIERVLSCTASRATLIGWGTIEKDQSNRFVLPLPESMVGSREWRRLIATLAWFSPVNSRHQQYRRAVLELQKLSGEILKCGTERLGIQPPNHIMNKGTALHNIYEGKKGVSSGDDLYFDVICREQAGSLDDPVPFAMAVSFEVGVDSKVDVYQEILDRTPLRIRETIPV